MAVNGQSTILFKGAAVPEGSDTITVRYISPIGLLKTFTVPCNWRLWDMLRRLRTDTQITYQSDGTGPVTLIAINGQPIDPCLKLQRRVVEVRGLRFEPTSVYFEFRYAHGEPSQAALLVGNGFAGFQSWAEGRSIYALAILVDGSAPNAPVKGLEAGGVSYYAE